MTARHRAILRAAAAILEALGNEPLALRILAAIPPDSIPRQDDHD